MRKIILILLVCFNAVSMMAQETLQSVTDRGNVGIGTTSPSEKLSVNGKIRSKEIKVEIADWSDFVFAKDYKLPTLQEIENHIKEKGHLPGIPSAKEVKTNGVELGEMNAKLLQKVEELTLYLIEQNKQITNQQKVNQSDKIQLQSQQEQIDELKQQLNKITISLSQK